MADDSSDYDSSTGDPFDTDRARPDQWERDTLTPTERLTDSGGWELDCRTDTLRWTAGTRRLHGVDQDYEPTLESALSFYHEDDRPTIETALNRAIEAGESFDETLRLITADDDQRWVSVSGDPIRADGDTVIIRGAIQDVTEHVEDKRELEMKSQALDQTDIGLTITDVREPGEPLIYVNEAFLRMTGYSREEVLGENARLLRGPETDPERAAKIETAVENGEETTVDIRNYRKDGTIFWNRVRIRPFREQSDEVTHFLDIQQDVTERKERRRELRETTLKLQALVSALPDVVTLKDREGNQLEVFDTSAPADLLGSAPTSGAREQPPTDIFTGETARRAQETIQAAIETGAVQAMEYQLDVPAGERWFEAKVAPLEEPVEGTETVVWVARDITERKERKRELKETKEELERSNEKLERFAYIASHDLQEPLRMVSSYVDLLEMELGEELDAETQEYLEFAVDGAERMREMIDGLLQFSRVQTQGEPFEPIDVADTLADVRKDLELRIDEADATIEVGDLPTIQADPNQLGQVFQNLIKNAIDHGGEGVHVEVSASRVGDTIEFAVADDGPGIPEDRQENIFGMFDTGQESDGTGIGLAVCQEIVNRHGGEIWIDSVVGEGTTFRFTIPDEPVQE